MISIIIPVYNAEQFIVKCLDSCFIQGGYDIEVLAVDDGSTDSSGNILEQYALKEPRLKVFHQCNSGVVTARNVGIAHANGEWMMFVDSDDYITDDAIEIFLKTAEETGAEIVVGDIYNVRKNKLIERKNLLSYGSSKSGIACALLSYDLHFSLSGKIFKSYLLREIKTDADLKIGEDAYLVIQLCENAQQVVIINHPVYFYVYRGESALNSPNQIALQSRLKFVALTIDYYLKKSYWNERQFQDALSKFIINESFSYLSNGGEYSSISKELLGFIHNFLKNKQGRACIPLWRIMMLKAFNISRTCGKCYRFIFTTIRSLLR